MASLVSHVKHWSVQVADQQPRATYAYSASQARTVTVEGRRVRVLVEEANSPDQVLLDFIKYFNFDYRCQWWCVSLDTLYLFISFDIDIH